MSSTRSSRIITLLVGASWLCLVFGSQSALAAPASAEASAPAKAESVGASDAVDEAYARGTRAAGAGDWAGAALAWEQARSLLPMQQPQLSYDLGTAYAHLGELGYATVHLQRSRRADSKFAQDAQRNLAIVRRRAEISAAARDRELSQAPSWGERLATTFAAPVMAWIVLISGWLAFAAWAWRRRMRAVTERSGGQAVRGDAGAQALSTVLGIFFVIGALAHAAARDSATVAHQLIVLEDGLAAREGPGSHQKAAFEIVAGSRVFEEERRAGWVMVRMPGGLAGWVEDRGVVALNAAEAKIPRSPGKTSD